MTKTSKICSKLQNLFTLKALLYFLQSTTFYEMKTKPEIYIAGEGIDLVTTCGHTMIYDFINFN